MKTRRWSLLNDDRTLVDQIADGWEGLLADPSKSEEHYHQHLAKNAGMFFGNPGGCHACVSKLALGGDYETDFVLLHDDGSYGFVYEFVEIESPHTPAFTSKGTPSQRLLQAIKQISDWRDWLNSHATEAKRLFPSKMLHVYGKGRFNFTIYISRRSELLKNDSLRKRHTKAHNVSIRSFERLTDFVRIRPFLNSTLLYSAEEGKLGEQDRIELANPFFEAMKGKRWKSISADPRLQTAHMYANNISILLSARSYSEAYEVFLQSTG